MIIEIDVGALDGLARAWLKEVLSTLEELSVRDYVHPDDAKAYKKNIKAAKRLLAYIGE
jgi:hypothetical protein